MKRTKEELLNVIREHGGETPDDFTIAMLEDVADSFLDVVDNTEELESLKTANAELTTAKDALESAYNELKKSYADRFTLKEEKEEKTEEVEEEVIEETYDSIF